MYIMYIYSTYIQLYRLSMGLFGHLTKYLLMSMTQEFFFNLDNLILRSEIKKNLDWLYMITLDFVRPKVKLKYRVSLFNYLFMISARGTATASATDPSGTSSTSTTTSHTGNYRPHGCSKIWNMFRAL